MLPSGRWNGWYAQGWERFPQSQDLLFADGIVRGTGTDDLGAFTVEGEYALDASDQGRVGWVKTYRGSHSVLYLGTWDGRELSGRWEIRGTGDAFGFLPPKEVR